MTSAEATSRAMSRANVPRWQLICGALVIRPDRCLTQLVRPLGAGRVAAVTAWSSTLLGPEGTAANGAARRQGQTFGQDRFPSSLHAPSARDRPYLENCTVDASIICSCQVNKGTRWMPWYQEPKKDVGACDKPRGVGNQT